METSRDRGDVREDIRDMAILIVLCLKAHYPNTIRFLGGDMYKVGFKSSRRIMNKHKNEQIVLMSVNSAVTFFFFWHFSQSHFDK